MEEIKEKEIEEEMMRIFEERGGLDFPSEDEFRLLEEEAIENLLTSN
jgi:hypothetical protein